MTTPHSPQLAAVRAALSQLDGTPESAISLLTGVPVERLGEYGGMPAPRVIGLDLSLTATGIASSLGWCESLGEDGITKLPLNERLDAIDTLTRRILILIGGGCGNWPALVAIEIPAYSRSGAGSHERSALWWSVVRSLRRREVPVAEVPIQQRMRYATGKGSASKGAVIDAVARRLPMFQTGGDDNCADAAVLAAMGADHLGAPLADMPAANRKALDAVQWPEPARPVVAPYGTHGHDHTTEAVA